VLFELHGKPSKGRAVKKAVEPMPTTGDLSEPPEWLNEAQRAGWRYAIQHAPPGVLGHIDRGVLAVWIMAEDLHRRASVAQNNAGTLLVKAPNTGTPLQSPYLAIINRQGLIMLKAAGELGFSPVSRPRIGAGAPAGIPAASLRTSPHAARGQKPRPTLDAFLDSHPDSQAIN
jgi:phage terminase small subunit